MTPKQLAWLESVGGSITSLFSSIGSTVYLERAVNSMGTSADDNLL